MIATIKATIATLLLLISPLSSSYYPSTMRVIDVDKNIDTIFLESYNGCIYEFYGSEDWDIGDYASVIVGTNGTADDYILEARYYCFN